MAELPNWIIIAFLLAFCLIIWHINQAVKEGAALAGFSPEKIKSISRKVYFFYFGWFAFVMALTSMGFVSGNVLPPRPIIFFTVPLLLFYFLWVYRHSDFRLVLEKVNLETLVRIHIFRLIGSFFLVLWWMGFLPKEWAFTAGLGDIATAVFSIIATWYVIGKKKAAIWLYIWNIFGLIDILVAVGLAVYITKLSIENPNIQSLVTITRFPFVMVPAFAPATIIFLHYIIFRRLGSYKQQEQ